MKSSMKRLSTPLLVLSLVVLCIKNLKTSLNPFLACESCRSLFIAPIEANTTVECSNLEERAPRRENSLPYWIPGYPGSGSELTRDLVHSLTGLKSRNAYHDLQNTSSTMVPCQQPGTLTCKTHWPALRRPNPIPMKQFFQSEFILLIRNPLHSIPSYFNQWWEVRHGIPSHSQQAPEQMWLRWRNRRFDREIENWKNMIEQWYSSSFYAVKLLLPLEELTDNAKGPLLAGRLADALGSTSDGAGCHWHRVVKGQPSKKRQNHIYTPSFTPQQMQKMQLTLRGLLVRFHAEPELVRVLTLYLGSVTTSAPMYLQE